MEWGSTVRIDGGKTGSTEARLAAASDRLGTVLEAVDLEQDREFAEAVVDAVAATERAYRLKTEEDERLALSTDGQVQPHQP